MEQNISDPNPLFEHQITGRAHGRSNFPRYDSLPLGFERFWYPIIFATSVRKRPVSVKVCGHEIVLVRARSGEVKALEDRCAHRGIPLSSGSVEFPGTITCAYHGWTYDAASGDLVAALTDGPESPVVGTKGTRVRTFPVLERSGLIWIYPGSDSPPSLDDQLPEEFLDPDVLVLGRISEQRGDWRHAAEAGFDEGHAKYLHRNSVWKTFRYLPAYSSLEVQRSEDGRWLSRVVADRKYSGEYPNVGRWPPPKPFWKRLEGRGAKAAAFVAICLPGTLRIQFKGELFGSFVGWEFWVPSELGRYRYVQLVTRAGRGPRRLAFKVWYWIYMRWAYHRQFNGQDTRMIEQMRTPPESLYRPDISIVEWRRLCEQALETLDDDV